MKNNGRHYRVTLRTFSATMNCIPTEQPIVPEGALSHD